MNYTSDKDAQCNANKHDQFYMILKFVFLYAKQLYDRKITSMARHRIIQMSCCEMSPCGLLLSSAMLHVLGLLFASRIGLIHNVSSHILFYLILGAAHWRWKLIFVLQNVHIHSLRQSQTSWLTLTHGWNDWFPSSDPGLLECRISVLLPGWHYTDRELCLWYKSVQLN